MPASLVAAFDKHCAGLEVGTIPRRNSSPPDGLHLALTASPVRMSLDGQATVDYSINALSKLRREATKRDKLLLQSIGSDVDRLREFVSALKAELQPRLERLSASEQRSVRASPPGRAVAGSRL